MAEEPQPKPAGGRLPVCGLCLELAATDDAEQSPSAASENEAQAATPATQAATAATPDQPAELAVAPVAPVADFRHDADDACEACGGPCAAPRLCAAVGSPGMRPGVTTDRAADALMAGALLRITAFAMDWPVLIPTENPDSGRGGARLSHASVSLPGWPSATAT